MGSTLIHSCLRTYFARRRPTGHPKGEPGESSSLRRETRISSNMPLMSVFAPVDKDGHRFAIVTGNHEHEGRGRYGQSPRHGRWGCLEGDFPRTAKPHAPLVQALVQLVRPLPNLEYTARRTFPNQYTREHTSNGGRKVKSMVVCYPKNMADD